MIEKKIVPVMNNVVQEKKNEYSIRNILGNQKKDDELFTPEKPIKILMDIIKLPKKITIWCPFDTEKSNFVKLFRESKYNVIHTHISESGHDFYKFSPKKWDVIISNPPFSKKRLLIERCEALKKPFCLLYGCTIFSQSMGKTLNRLKFYFIQNNVTFLNLKNEKKSFQCCWVFNKAFHDKYLKKPWKVKI